MHKITERITLGLLCLVVLACQLPSLIPVPGNTKTPTPITVPRVTPRSKIESGSRELPNTPLPEGAPDTERYQRIFRKVWRTVDLRYVTPTFNGTDWNAVREEFEPQVLAAPDDVQFWQLMQEMIARLQDDHSVYLTPAEVEEEDQAMSGDLDYVGIGVYVSMPEDVDYAVVLFPFPGGPAEASGIRAHDRILSIDGLQVCCDEEGYDNLDAMLGVEGSAVNLSLQYPGESIREVSVMRTRIQGQLPILSRVITSTVSESRGVGYVLIPTLWDETVAERTRDVLQDVLSTPTITGLVIDMRINGGGAYTELYDLLSVFTHGDAGAFVQRDEIVDNLVIMADPIANSQDIPMIVLVGSETESYAEVFSGALQAQGRAQLVGEPTAGNVETVYPYDFEDGSRLWLAEETFAVPGVPSWESYGVQPDVYVPGRWEDITEENDAVLDTAVAMLLGED